MLNTATPVVTLGDSTTNLNDEFDAIIERANLNYADLSDEALLDGLVSGTKKERDRHWDEFYHRVQPTVAATARKLIVNPDDRDDAINFAIAMVMNLEEHAKVLTAVQNGFKLANCIAARIKQNTVKAHLNAGAYAPVVGNGEKRQRTLDTIDFTADETHRTVNGNSYTMDALEEALDAALFDAPTEADEACDWFREETNGHLTADEQDALLHSTGLTREVGDYLDDLAITNPAQAARAFNAVNPNPKSAARRTGPARLPQTHVGNIMGCDQSWVSVTIDSGENAIFANTGLTRDLRRGMNGTRRVILEDIVLHLTGWLKTYAEQAGVTADEATVRAIPQAYWTTVLDEFGYDPDDYSDADIADIISAVIAGVTA